MWETISGFVFCKMDSLLLHVNIFLCSICSSARKAFVRGWSDSSEPALFCRSLLNHRPRVHSGGQPPSPLPPLTASPSDGMLLQPFLHLLSTPAEADNKEAVPPLLLSALVASQVHLKRPLRSYSFTFGRAESRFPLCTKQATHASLWNVSLLQWGLARACTLYYCLNV